MVHDPVGNRVFVFGGDSLGVYKNETYVLELDGTPHWSRILGPAPQARSGHVAAYDPWGQRILIHGGRGANGLRNDTWELLLGGEPEWSPIVLEGLVPIQPREHATAVADIHRNRMLVFGGKMHTQTSGDLWELPLDGSGGWQAVTPATGATPTGRRKVTGGYDSATGRWWLIGGEDANAQPIHEVWEFWDPATPPVGVDGDRTRNALALSAPMPNPTRGSVTFALTVPMASEVRLEVFDVSGRLVRGQEPRRYEAGRHTVAWDGLDGAGARRSPGLYFVRVTAVGAHAVQRIVATD
jgi:hypothetical protein